MTYSSDNLSILYQRYKNNSLVYLLIALCLSLIFCLLILAAVPPVSRDALTHHLFVPRLYLEHGGIYEIPNIPFSYYPMNLDLLYMIPLYFGNDILPKYIHFAFALATAGLIYNYLKTRLTKNYGLLGALFFLSIPIIVKLSITVYVDLGLMFFTTASILLLFRWLDSGYKIKFLLMAGVFLGLAAGTKYNGLISLFLLPLFVPVLYLRTHPDTQKNNLKSIGAATIFLSAALIIFSPWLIRNYAWTGNPIYPLHNALFQRIKKSSTTKNGAALENHSRGMQKIQKISLLGKLKNLSGNSSIFTTRKILYHETWWQALLLPVRFFFQGQDDNPQYFDGKLNPFLFLLPFFAFLKKSGSRLQGEKFTLLAFALLFFFFTFFQEAMRIRYMVTIVPALVLLSMVGLHNISEALSCNRFFPNGKTKKLFILVIVTAMLGYNGQYIRQQFNTIQPISYIQGKISRDQYITKFRPEYPVIQYANNHIGSNAKVLCLFLGNRGYYMHFKPIFRRPAHTIFFEESMNGNDAQAIKNELIRRGINHILLRNDLTDNWFQHLGHEKKKRILAFFQQDTIQAYSRDGYTLYNLR